MNRNPQEKTEKRRRSNKTESSTEHKPLNAPSRSYRIAAFAFIVLITAAIAGGVLYLRTHLDDVRDRIYAELLTRSGLRLEAATIEPHRFRGIRLIELEASWSPENGAVIYVSAPEATIDISLSDLLTGQITIERFHLESAEVTITLDEEDDDFWSKLLEKDQEPGKLDVAFRLTGNNCALSVYGLRDTPAIQFANLDFDIAHLPDARDIHARISGVFDSELSQNFQVHMRYATVEDFDLRLETENITEHLAQKYFPEYATWISHGTIHPNLRISGQDEQRVLILLEAGFNNLLFNELPVLDTPAHGTLTVLATYDIKNRLLDLNAAQADAVPAGGRLDGFISFAEKVPELDLHLTMRHLPVVELVDTYFQQQLEELGTLTLTLEEPHEIQLDITGPLLEPDFVLLARIAAGNVIFVPNDKKIPEANIDFTQLRLEWLGREQNPEATFNLAGGTVQHAESNFELQHLYGNVQLTQDRLVLDGLRAEVFGDIITGSVTYNTTTKQADVVLNGVLHGLDSIPWLERVPKLRLAGSAAVRCTGSLTSNRYQLDLTIDATQTLVEYDWWFQKVSGMGANISTLNIDVIPRKSISIAGNALLDTTPLSTSIDLEWNGERWQGRHARVRTETINVVTAGKCIRVPYAFRGKPGQNGEFEWRRLPDATDRTTITLKGFFEEGAIYPDGSEIPIQVRNLDIEAIYANANGSKETNLYIQAEYGRTPPLTESWLKPIRPEDPELDALFPRSNMITRFQADVDELILLPWEGRDFRGHGFASENTIHLEHFAADVGEGNVNGNYFVDRIENLVELNATWERVPSEFLLAHLDFPAALDGPNTGEVRYIIDRDDPNTLRGSGSFEIDNGQFSADFISKQFEQYLQGDISSLPPSMRFTRLRSEIGLEGDMVRTPNMLLIGDGVTITGGGHFYLHGDMHYDINVSVSPNTAERIPVLRDNFNIEGHRITQNDIVLGFRISGPMFNPSGQLAGLPGVGVTLVSGAGQVTSDALKVITVPGQILLDLLKIGGSIVGGTR